MRAGALLLALVPAIASASPTEVAFTRAAQFAADVCTDEAYPKAASKHPKKGQLAVRVTAGPGAAVTVDVLPVEEPVGAGDTWAAATLGACMRKHVASVMPPLTTKTKEIVYVALGASPVAVDGSRDVSLATSFAQRRLGAVAKACRVIEQLTLSLDIDMTGRATITDTKTPACLARAVAKLGFPAGPAGTIHLAVAPIAELEEERGRVRAALRAQLVPPTPPPKGACYVGGCSGEACSENPRVTTTCEMRPEYACLKHSQCTRQRNGACGWTPTPAYKACLTKPPQD